MPSPPEVLRWRVLTLAWVGAVLLVAGATPAAAAEVSGSSTVIVRPGDVRADDLYTAAINVIVSGTVDGDLFAFAAEEITIDGTVTGSVVAVAPVVTVTGSIGHSLRALTNSLRVGGEVGRDIVAAAWGAELGRSSFVQGDVHLWGMTMSALGGIGGDLRGTQRRLALAGEVGGSVDVSVSRLEVVEDLFVRGDLGYRSVSPAEGLEQASVDGVVVRRTPLPPNVTVRALALFSRFMALVVLTGAALGVGYAWPRRTAVAIARAGASPLRAWGSGALVMASPLLVAAAGAVVVTLAPPAAGFPLLAAITPVVLALTGLVAALALVAGIPVVGWLGGALFKRLDMYGALLVGSLLVGLLWLLPVVGWLVPLVVLPLGVGAWRLSLGDTPPS